MMNCASPGNLNQAWTALLLLVLSCISPGIEAAHLQIGLLRHPVLDEAYTGEWTWALRGGGADFKLLDQHQLSSLDARTPLLIIDNAPLDKLAAQALRRWVNQGGILIYAGAEAALQELDEQGNSHTARKLLLGDLLGARFNGFDPGLAGVYPDITTSSTLLSPLQEGDALRFGTKGIGHTVSIKTTDAEILAHGVRLSPGPGGINHKSSAATILTKQYGRGRVVFLSFSPAHIALCYPKPAAIEEAHDCTGAGQAHALMRWLSANLLWEERRLQLPLLWESPGDRPHAVVITGDVHNNPFEVRAAVRMGKIMDQLGLPLSLYMLGQIADDYPREMSQLQVLDTLEISPHSADGEVYWTRRFRFTGALGILFDLEKALKLLDVPRYPSERDWLISTRNESWQSDEGAWWAMERKGVGLVFDFTADSITNSGLYLSPLAWFDGGENQRLFVPFFERSVSTPVDSFRLRGEREKNMSSLASAQAEPCCIPLSYRAYTSYIDRWHALFSRLSSMGGLSEVWLWHPGGVALKHGFPRMAKTLRKMQQEPTVSFVRGDALATWRYNRELYSIKTERDTQGSILNLSLSQESKTPKNLPHGAPEFTATTSYWVLGPLELPNWKSRHWHDPTGRVVTVLVHPLDTGRQHQ